MDFIYKLADIARVAASCWSQLAACSLTVCSGEMGAGKTTFIRALGTHLRSETPMHSPSFSLVNAYHTPYGVLYHMDMYRVQSELDFQQLDLPFYLRTGLHCFMEWGDKFATQLDYPYAQLHLDVLSADTRKLTLRLPGHCDSQMH